MCGIAGIIVKQGSYQDLPYLMQNLLASIAHRGPDGEGSYQDGPLILGHRRLAIIDLSAQGHQPMHSDDQSLSIVFNGEIYNYREIKAELLTLGHQFRSQTDTEVILQAYRQWGQDCISRFNGMWAFAIYDHSLNQLFCARDRFGVKPFYYINTPKYFMFCSEIKGLLPYLAQQSANQSLILDYLLTQKTDHQAASFFHGIEKLPGGHQLSYHLKTHVYKIQAYYQLGPKTATPSIYLEHLADAVKLRLRSDVPVGTCLSGGLDSSSIAALAAQNVEKGGFHALTAISEHPENDESSYAQRVVNHCQLVWQTIQPRYQDFHDHIAKIMWTQEEPFASPSIVMQYFVMQLAKQAKIPVLLDGQGGDETLLGYERYQMAYLFNIWQKSGIKASFQAWAQAHQHNQKLAWPQALTYLLGSYFPKARFLAYCKQHPYLKIFPKCPQHLYAYADAAKDMLELQMLDLHQTNLPALLRFEDKNAMAHGIETRLPFLDYRVVELGLGLPNSAKIHQGWSKHILRTGMQNLLPESILWRKNKFGFEAPEKIWLTQHQNSMQDLVLASELLKQICRPKPLARGFVKFPARIQWRLYTIALWEQTFKLGHLA
jgi:asparagine synthase (glutamine-hydrolysing)